MAEDVMKEVECFQKDYDKLYAKGTWNKDELSMMKDYKKLIYYSLVIDSMMNGNGYPGEEYMPNGMSGRRMRNPMNGQYMSGNMYPYMDRNMYYDGMNTSGRRYYDSEKEKAIHMLHHMMDNTDDPERKNTLKFALNELEQK